MDLICYGAGAWQVLGKDPEIIEMTMIKYSRLLVCFALLAFVGSGNAADTILYNARIITVDGDFTVAEAVAIAGDRIVAQCTGSSPQLAPGAFRSGFVSCAKWRETAGAGRAGDGNRPALRKIRSV